MSNMSQDPSPFYNGEPLCSGFGGVRGAGTSERETLPSGQVFPKKIGYDEHRAAGLSTVHGVHGVEGMPEGDASGSPENHGATGYDCPHGCGGRTFNSRHGLARHVHAKHGGFGGLGHAFGDKKPKHCASEKDKPAPKKEWEPNDHEYNVAQSDDSGAPHSRVGSSY